MSTRHLGIKRLPSAANADVLNASALGRSAPGRLSSVEEDEAPRPMPRTGHRRGSSVATLIQRRGSLRDLISGKPVADEGDAGDDLPAPMVRRTSLLGGRRGASTTELAVLTFRDDAAGPPLEVEGVCDVCLDPKKREAAGLQRIGRGAYAQVVCFTSSARVKIGSKEVPASRLAVKVGTWPSEAALERERDCQAAAAAAGVAPHIYAAVWGKPLAAVAMERGTGPSYHGWLTWLSKDLLRRPAFQTKEDWVVDPRVFKLPLVKAWATEHKRVRDRLAAAGIRHGDVHDANIIFHIPSVADNVFGAPTLVRTDGHVVATDADEKTLKRTLMRAIAKGPSAGGARLMIIDFGQAKRLDAVGKLCLSLCGDDHRLVDPHDCDAASDVTELDARPEDLFSDAYVGAVKK